MTEQQHNNVRARIGHLTWLGWMIILILAAVLLPPLDSRIQPHPTVAVFVVVCCAALLTVTCISLFRYFRDSWRKWRSVSNRTEYLIWLSLETFAAIGVLVAAVWGYTRL